MVDEVVAEESYGDDSLCSQYVITSTSGQLKKKRLYQDNGLASLFKFIKDAFLPQGYPHSVSSDYVEYQIWDTCQAFCSSIVSALAAQAMLKAYGVGDEKATVLAATLTWLLKDGAGMVGRIMFTWMKGTELDCHAKKWRLAADVINDLTYFIELLAPMFKEYFLLFACMSSICRSLVGVSGGATRAALTQHQARRDNMADVSAKDGSQETMVNLLAFIVNLAIVPLVTGKERIIWLLFFVFTALHLYCNFRAVSAVVMETINSTRMQLLVENFISQGEILSPKEIAAREPILRTVMDLVIRSPKLRTKDASHSEMTEFALNNLCSLWKQIYETREFPAAASWDMVAYAHNLTLKVFPAFLKGLEAYGWVTSRTHLGPDEWRADWNLAGSTTQTQRGKEL